MYSIMFTPSLNSKGIHIGDFIKPKRGIAYILGKQIFEKYFLCCIKQGRPCHWSDPTDHLSETVVCRCFQKNFLKNFANFTEKKLCWSLYLFIVKLVTFLRTPFSRRTHRVAASDLSFVQIPKLQGTYSSVSTVFFTSGGCLYFIWRNPYTNYKFRYS